MLVSSKLKGKPWVSSTQNPSTSHWVRRISWKRWNECSTIVPARWLWKRNSSDEYGRSEKRTFNEYYHDKIVMANRISIDTDEIIDYVVEGIPDVRLCDQARLLRFKNLIEAFENIMLRKEWAEFRWRHSQKAEGENKDSSEHSETSPAPRGIKCFNCKERGHRATKYVKLRTAASKLMDTQLDESAGKMSKIASEMNLLQPFVGSKPYTISVTYIASNKESNIQPYLCISTPSRR